MAVSLCSLWRWVEGRCSLPQARSGSDVSDASGPEVTLPMRAALSSCLGAPLAPGGRGTVYNQRRLETMNASTTDIRDRAGNVVGHIESRPNGDQVLRDAENKVRGYYDYAG